METITPDQLRDWLDGGAPPVIVDVREPWEAEICFIPGAQLVPMSTLPDGAARLPAEGPLVMLCHHGVRSAQVGAWLEQQGHGGIYNLSGGIDAWARDVDPAMDTY